MIKEITPEKGTTNYSKILRKFVHPIVKESDDISRIESKYAFGIHVWNAATVKAKDERLFQKAKTQVAEKAIEIPEAGRLFEEMVTFKQKEFATYKNVVIDFEILELSDKGYDLTVASAPLKK